MFFVRQPVTARMWSSLMPVHSSSLVSIHQTQDALNLLVLANQRDYLSPGVIQRKLALTAFSALTFSLLGL